MYLAYCPTCTRVIVEYEDCGRADAATPRSVRRQEITVTITPDGHATVTVNGVAGPACEALTKDLEAALGAATKKRHTPDHYRTQAASRATVRRSPTR